MKVFVLVLLGLLTKICVCKKTKQPKKDAVVTLVAGESSGYDGGAIALGQSLKEVGSKLHRVILVDSEVISP